MNPYWYPHYLKAINVNYKYFREDSSDYPEVDPNVFVQSASHLNQLTSDVQELIAAISSSTSYAKSIMDAAQIDDKALVVQLLEQSINFSHCTVQYTPSSLMVTLTHPDGSQFGQMTVKFPWNGGIVS